MKFGLCIEPFTEEQWEATMWCPGTRSRSRVSDSEINIGSKFLFHRTILYVTKKNKQIWIQDLQKNKNSRTNIEKHKYS